MSGLRKNASLKQVALRAVLLANRARRRLKNAWEYEAQLKEDISRWTEYGDAQAASTKAFHEWNELAELASHLARHAGVSAPKDWVAAA